MTTFVKVSILTALVLTSCSLSGCIPGNKKEYRAVDTCAVTKPPIPDRFLDATPDERLVYMTNSYISQVKEVTLCNERIKATNSYNKAK